MNLVAEGPISSSGKTRRMLYENEFGDRYWLEQGAENWMHQSRLGTWLDTKTLRPVEPQPHPFDVGGMVLKGSN